MKKRGATLLFCLLLVLQLALPVRAAGSVYFVAAEASVLPLTDATMPFWSGGYLYVPASVFTGFDISIINNTAKKIRCWKRTGGRSCSTGKRERHRMAAARY